MHRIASQCIASGSIKLYHFHTIVLYYPSQPTHLGRGDKLGCSITFNVCASFSRAHAQ